MMNTPAKLIALASLLIASGNAAAQCGAGIPSGGNPLCIPPDVYHGQSHNQPQAGMSNRQPVIIRQKWEDRWGAMVLDDVKPITGFSTGARTKSEAMRLAKMDCLSKGGGGCGNLFAYRSQCAVMMAVKGGGAYYISAPTIEKAERIGLNDCANRNETCRVAYSNCSLPEAVPIH